MKNRKIVLEALIAGIRIGFLINVLLDTFNIDLCYGDKILVSMMLILISILIKFINQKK
jgi:hypothetical protein